MYSKYSSLLGNGTGVYIGTDGISIGGVSGFVIKSDGNASMNKVEVDDFTCDDAKVTKTLTVVQGINLTTVPRIYNNSIEYMNFSSLDVNFLKHIKAQKGLEVTGDIDLYSGYSKYAQITGTTTYLEPNTLKLGKSTTTLGFLAVAVAPRKQFRR